MGLLCDASYSACAIYTASPIFLAAPSRWRIPENAPGKALTITLPLIFRQHLGHGLVSWPEEMGGEILREQRVGLRAGDGFLRVPRVFVARTGKCDQRGGKFHLRVVSLEGDAAQRNRLLDHGVAVHAR